MSATAFHPQLLLVTRHGLIAQARLLVRWALDERRDGNRMAFHAYVHGAKAVCMPMRSVQFPRVNDTRIPPATTQPGAEGAQPVKANPTPQDQAPGLLSCA